jgi:hypothetical protein
VEGLLNPTGGKVSVVTENAAGLTLYLDPGKVEKSAKARVREALQGALAVLDRPQPDRFTRAWCCGGLGGGFRNGRRGEDPRGCERRGDFRYSSLTSTLRNLIGPVLN